LLEYAGLKGIDGQRLSMDSCMTQAPLGGEKTGQNPTERTQRGTKRSLLVEGQVIPLGLAVAGANRPDLKMVEATLGSIPVPRPLVTDGHEQNLCLDKGYASEEVRATVQEFGFTAHIPAKGQEAQRAKRKARGTARRWVVTDP
jgi:hypothetical protein